MSTLRSEDDDWRGNAMAANPTRYFDEAWERGEQEVLAERAADGAPTRRPIRPRTTLGPGIVEMSLRGNDDTDIERLVAAMRGAGIVVWRVPERFLKDGHDVGYRYFSVEVPRDADG